MVWRGSVNAYEAQYAASDLRAFTADAISETPEHRPKSWRRNGASNEFLDDRRREQIRRDKRIVDFESSYACKFDPADLDDGLLREVRGTWPNAATGLSDEELLHQLGAIERDGTGYYFTKAGTLFFSVNPHLLQHSSDR